LNLSCLNIQNNGRSLLNMINLKMKDKKMMTQLYIF